MSDSTPDAPAADWRNYRREGRRSGTTDEDSARRQAVVAAVIGFIAGVLFGGASE
jgi:hypothetical protein